jgi:hypothetical protein
LFTSPTSGGLAATGTASTPNGAKSRHTDSFFSANFAVLIGKRLDRSQSQAFFLTFSFIRFYHVLSPFFDSFRTNGLRFSLQTSKSGLVLLHYFFKNSLLHLSFTDFFDTAPSPPAIFMANAFNHRTRSLSPKDSHHFCQKLLLPTRSCSCAQQSLAARTINRGLRQGAGICQTKRMD